MKTSYLLISAAWVATLFAAYTIGTKSESSTHENVAASDNPIRPATRYSSRGKADTTAVSQLGSRTSPNGGSSFAKGINITELMKKSDPIFRSQKLLELIDSLGAEDFEQAVADFRALGMTRERMSEYAMLLHAWAKVDPLAALAYAEKNTGTPFARQTILASWSANSPDAALSWAEQNHEGEGANPWFVGVIRGIVETDPDRASDILKKLPFSRERGEALAAIVPHIAKQGSDAASEWIQSIDDERLRQGAASYLSSELARKDPTTAANWATSLSKGVDALNAVRGVARVWAKSDTQAAVAWSNTLIAEQKLQAAREIIGEYAGEKPAEALQWIHGMSNESKYEDVLRSFIWNTARQNPEISLSQVPEIADNRSQQLFYERIVRGWYRRDQAAAEVWMSNSSLSEELRKRITNPSRPRGR